MRFSLLIFIVALSGLLFTCNILEQEPLDRRDIGTFFNSDTDAESSLIGCYQLAFQSDCFPRYLMYNQRSSGNMTAPLDGPGSDPIVDRRNLEVNNDGGTADLWRLSYQAITNINLLLERVPAMPDELFMNLEEPDQDRKAEIIGEASFMRAFLYYHLVMNWGPVPLMLNFPTSSDPSSNYVARAPEDEVWGQILLDLEIAEENLPWNHNTRGDLEATQRIQSKGRATKGAAKLLLAKIYLQNQQWQQAEEKAREILESGEFTLTNRWINIFNPAISGQNTSETILEIQAVSGPNEFNNTGGYSWFHQDGRPRRGATREAYELFEGDENNPVDVRQEFSMAPRDDNPEEIYALKYQNAAPWWDPPDPFNFIPMRLTEVLLIIAETRTELSYPDPEALEIINTIRARTRDLDFPDGPIPGVTAWTYQQFSSKEEFVRALRDERRRELMFEGHMFYDLLRYDSYDGGDRAMRANFLESPEKLRYPIPLREMRVNPLLEQNPGY